MDFKARFTTEKELIYMYSKNKGLANLDILKKKKSGCLFSCLK